MLETVFSETEHLDCLQSVLHSGQVNSEAKIRNTLAIHYFQPLVYGSSCFVDRGGSDICEHCKKKVRVDDTSLGNPKIWHGRTDIIIKNSIVTVQCDICHSDDLASGEPAAKQRKTEENPDPEYSVKLDKKLASYAIEQALAEAIVNAFCEAKRNKSFYNKLIPSFLASEKEIRIILYNCDSDILLLSDPLKIWRSTCTEDGEIRPILNVDTLMQVWLALNFDSFDMKVEGEILKRTSCSNFKQVVGENAYHLYLKQVFKPCKFYNEDDKGVLRVVDNDTVFVVTEIQKQQYFRIKNILTDKAVCQ